MQVKDLKLDKRNYNKHNEENKRLIKKSIDECGFGRSVVIDNDGEVICGNGVVSTLDDNTNIKVVETDGNELVVIRRKDLKREDEKRDKLAILDNSTGKLSEWDYDLLKEDFEEDYLNSLGIELPELEIQSETEQKDISDDLKEGYEVVCECETEQEQEQLFYKLTEEGIKCRLLTL